MHVQRMCTVPTYIYWCIYIGVYPIVYRYYFFSFYLVYLFIIIFCPFNRMIFMSRFRRRRNNLYKAVLYVRTEYRSTAVVYARTLILPPLRHQVNNIIHIYVYVCVCFIQARLYPEPCAYMKIVAYVSRSSSCNIFITFSVTIISYSCVVVK